MAKKKQNKKTAAKAAKKTKPRKAATAAKKKSSPKAARKKAVAKNRRQFRRIATTRLWVTERSGDYQFMVPVANVSEGGIFLKGRLKTTSAPSQISIPTGTAGEMLELAARPLHDRLLTNSCGTGYEFVGVSAQQLKSLRTLLRNLN